MTDRPHPSSAPGHAQPSRNAKVAFVALTAITFALLFGPSACTIGGTSSTAAENDRLRRESLDQQATIKKLSGDIAELKTKIDELARLREQPIPTEVLAAVPRTQSVTISSLTRPIRAADGLLTGIETDFEPLDGRGRFLQVAGTVTITVHTPASPKAELGTLTLNPAQLRDAFRSGLTGSYYTGTVPIDHSAYAAAGSPASLLVHISLTDGLSGNAFTSERVIRAHRSDPDAPSAAASAPKN